MNTDSGEFRNEEELRKMFDQMVDPEKRRQEQEKWIPFATGEQVELKGQQFKVLSVDTALHTVTLQSWNYVDTSMDGKQEMLEKEEKHGTDSQKSGKRRAGRDWAEHGER